MVTVVVVVSRQNASTTKMQALQLQKPFAAYCGDASTSIPRLLLGIDMPDDIVGQAVDAVAGPLGHFREPFRLRLVLECVAGEIDAYTNLLEGTVGVSGGGWRT